MDSALSPPFRCASVLAPPSGNRRRAFLCSAVQRGRAEAASRDPGGFGLRPAVSLSHHLLRACGAARRGAGDRRPTPPITPAVIADASYLRNEGHRGAWGWTTVVGLIGGVFSGLFGVGGAFVAPPLLTTFFGLRQLEAQGLALALVCPSALLALLAYAGAGRVDWLVGLPLALGGIAAISAGVAFASRLPERRMRLAFCGLLLITAVLLAARG